MVWAVCIGPPDYWYMNRPLPDGTTKIDCQRSILTVGGRLREKKGRRRRRRGKEEQEEKKKEEEEKKKEDLLSPCRPRSWAIPL
ncbi:hypothetical protein BHE74_00059774, partial [Ensete ventricosum]